MTVFEYENMKKAIYLSLPSALFLMKDEIWMDPRTHAERDNAFYVISKSVGPTVDCLNEFSRYYTSYLRVVSILAEQDRYQVYSFVDRQILKLAAACALECAPYLLSLLSDIQWVQNEDPTINTFQRHYLSGYFSRTKHAIENTMLLAGRIKQSSRQ